MRKNFFNGIIFLWSPSLIYHRHVKFCDITTVVTNNHRANTNSAINSMSMSINDNFLSFVYNSIPCVTIFFVCFENNFMIAKEKTNAELSHIVFSFADLSVSKAHHIT